MRWAILIALAACHTVPPVTPIPDASDAAPSGTLHSYRCPVGDAGRAWTCQDGVTVPEGTCLSFGCVPQ